MQRPIIVSLLLALASGSVSAEIITIDDISLDGFQPVPPTGSLATGLATVMIDTDTRDITIDGVFSGFEGTVTMGHLHGPAGFGQSSGLIIIFLDIFPDEDPHSGSFHGAQRVSMNQLNNILDSRSYLNIHSSAYPGGEIRGQVVVPAPASAGLLLIGGGALASRRRRRV